MKAVSIVVFSTLISLSVYGDGAHDEGPGDVSQRFGPGKAVEAFNKDEGFKLSEKAMKSLGVEFLMIQGTGPWKLPKEALVRIKQSTGVYRRYDGWISLVLIKVDREENGQILIRSEDLEANDEVAVKGSQYLRMTDSDLNAGTVDSCAH